MARSRRRTVTDDELLGISNPMFKGKIPIVPTGTLGTPSGFGPGRNPPPGSSTTDTESGTGPGGTKTLTGTKTGTKAGGTKSGSSTATATASTASSYDKYLADQKREAAKAKQKAANRYVDQAQTLGLQANALRTLLGLKPMNFGTGGAGRGPGGGGGKGGRSGGTATATATASAGGKGKDSRDRLRGPWGLTGAGGSTGDGRGASGNRNEPKPGGLDPVSMARMEDGSRDTGRGGKKDGDPRDRLNSHGWGKDPKDKDRDHRDGKGGKGDDRDPDKKGHQGLRDKGLSAELKINLDNVMEAYRLQDKTLMEGFEKRVGVLGTQQDDNEKSTDAQTYAAMSNRGRERANAMSEVMAQGGGESDVLRSLGMSLRSWNANQSEVNRAFHDSLTSINSAVNDLNVDTKSARVQAAQGMIADKAQLWSGYFDAKSEAETQLGNTLGQMAEYYGMADEQVGSKKNRKNARRQNRAAAKSGKFFEKAARTASRGWDAPDVDSEIQDWQGAASFENQLTANAALPVGAVSMAKPEGATLRKWSA